MYTTYPVESEMSLEIILQRAKWNNDQLPFTEILNKSEKDFEDKEDYRSRINFTSKDLYFIDCNAAAAFGAISAFNFSFKRTHLPFKGKLFLLDERFKEFLIDAFEFLDHKNIFSLIMEENLADCLDKWSFVKMLNQINTNIYSKKDFRAITELFISDLINNKENLVESGYIKKYTAAPTFLHALLSNLYPILMPASVTLAKNQNEIDRIYEWNEPNYKNKTTSISRIKTPEGTEKWEVEYDGCIEPFTRDMQDFIKYNREKIYSLKLQIMNELLEGLKNKTIASSTQHCLEYIRKIFLREDLLYWFTQVEPHYKKRIYSSWCSSSGFNNYRYDSLSTFPGGLTEILFVMGYYEAEYKTGFGFYLSKHLQPIITQNKYNYKRISADSFFQIYHYKKTATIDEIFNYYIGNIIKINTQWQTYFKRSLKNLDLPQFENNYSKNIHQSIHELLNENNKLIKEVKTIKTIIGTPNKSKGSQPVFAFYKLKNKWHIGIPGQKNEEFKNTNGFEYLYFILKHTSPDQHYSPSKIISIINEKFDEHQEQSDFVDDKLLRKKKIKIWGDIKTSEKNIQENKNLLLSGTIKDNLEINTLKEEIAEDEKNIIILKDKLKRYSVNDNPRTNLYNQIKITIKKIVDSIPQMEEYLKYKAPNKTIYITTTDVYYNSYIKPAKWLLEP